MPSTGTETLDFVLIWYWYSDKWRCAFTVEIQRDDHRLHGCTTTQETSSTHVALSPTFDWSSSCSSLASLVWFAGQFRSVRGMGDSAGPLHTSGMGMPGSWPNTGPTAHAANNANTSMCAIATVVASAQVQPPVDQIEVSTDKSRLWMKNVQ